jgi:Protein of unknown function (DUF1569)
MDSYLERLQNAISSATRGMSAEDLTRAPHGKWCAAEILEHLYLTYTGTIKGFKRCLQTGKPLGSHCTFMQRVAIALVTELEYFPKGRKSPERACPKGMAVEKIVADIGPQIAAMGKLIAESEARYGSRTKVLDHPILGPLTARQWRKFHWVHGRHHVKQIQQRRTSI